MKTTDPRNVFSRIETSKHLPTLPHILLELINTCNKGDYSIREISRIINKDPSLSAKVLRIVNSPYYRKGDKVTGIEQALLHLGRDATKNMAISASVYNIFNKVSDKPPVFDLKLFWWHALMCAVLAKLMAEKISYSCSEEAFLAGLIHDLGKLVLWTNFPDDYAVVLESAKDQTDRLLAGEKQMGATHTEVGAWLLGRWNLPSLITDGVLYHHEPPARIVNAFPLTKIIYAANIMSRDVKGSDHDELKIVEEMFELGASELRDMISQAHKEVEQFAESLDIRIESKETYNNLIPDKDDAGQGQLFQRVKDTSLLYGTLQNLIEADDEDSILRVVRQGIQILFDIESISFFIYDHERDMLVGRGVACDNKADPLCELSIPLKKKEILPVKSLHLNTPLDSFGYLLKITATIADEQIIHLVGKQGILCLPMVSRHEYVGVIVLGVDEVEVSQLLKQLELLTLLSRQASLAILSEFIKRRQEKLKNEKEFIDEKLALTEGRYTYLVHNSPDIIFILGQAMEFIFINQTVETLLGYASAGLVGKHFTSIVNEQDIDTTNCYFKGIETGELRTDYLELRLKYHVPASEEDRYLTVELRAMQIHDISFGMGEKAKGIYGIARNITERKRLEAQLFQSQKMEAIGTLAGGIAHDFNNLLMGIQGYISLMLHETGTAHPYYEKLKSVEEQVRNGAGLTQQLLGFARGGRYEMKPANLNEIMEKTSTMFGRTKKEISIQKRYEKDIWTVEADQGQIGQVFLNLYVNAWQAMPGGGTIYLETANVIIDEISEMPFCVKAGKYVKASVTDTGVGMDDKTRERIFEPFFTTKEMGRGTGLGMATVYGIVKGHGGIITVNSSRGQGTRFDIYLPASEKVVIKEEERAPDELLKGKETILLVDDEEVIIDVTEEILRLLGYRVLVARSGQEAVNVYKSKKEEVDLVLLDMIMPEMGGRETFDILKSINPHIRVILSSGYDIAGRPSKMLNNGVKAFLQKPFTIENLAKKIRDVLDKK